MNYQIKKTIKSDINLVKNTVEDILLNIKDVLNDNNYFNAKIILSELIINGVKHGNCGDMDKCLNIKVLADSKSIVIIVTDEGCGIKYNPKIKEEIDFSETGRGLMLVEGLSDNFSINGNTVTCVKYLK